MDTIEDYRKILKQITDYAFGHGISSIGIKQVEKGRPDTWSKDVQTKFFIACNDGFKIAQNLLIEEIKKYQVILRQAIIELKDARAQKNKSIQFQIQRKIKSIEQRLHNFSHIADGIAWQLIGGQIHIARRFHIQEKSMKFLDSTNLSHTMQVVEKINETPSNFALISDLTSFIQIGDLLVRSRENIEIMELKEGEVNEQIANFLKRTEDKKSPSQDDYLKEMFDKKTFKQIKRMQRQEERANRAVDIINNDEGIDPVSGGHMKISTPSVTTETYHKELKVLHENLREKSWSYTVIDTCVHIGMYRDQSISMADFAIEQILKKNTDNYLIIDWLSITSNLSEPIFGKPFSPEFIIDILTGKVKIIIGLDADALIKTFNVFGLKANWLTEKETSKRKQTAVTKGIVVINKKGIVVHLPSGEEITIFGGIISKILYDSIKPSSVANSILSINESKTQYKNEDSII